MSDQASMHSTWNPLARLLRSSHLPFNVRENYHQLHKEKTRWEGCPVGASAFCRFRA